MSLPHGTVVPVEGVSPRPGARTETRAAARSVRRALSRRELIRMTRSRKRVEALLLGFSAWMADKKPRPLMQTSRVTYVSRIRRAIAICEEQGQSFLVADKRTLRFVLGSVPPHPSTQNCYISAFRLFFDFLISQKMRKDNPAKELGRPPLIKRLPRPIQIHDVCRYLDAAHRLGVQHYAIACLGLFMGLRRQEITEAQWSWFFQAEGRWWCDVTGKGGKTGREPVHAELRRVLTKLRETHRDPQWLFPSPVRAKAGYPMSMNTVVKKHFEIVEKAGIGHYTMHQLRHSFATYVRRVPNVDGAIVQKLMRHSSSASTEIYMDVLDDELGDAIDGLDFRRIRNEIHEKRRLHQQKGEKNDGSDGSSAGAAG